jgi:hypothetical protein
MVEPQAGTTSLYDFMFSARQSLDMILIADHQKGVRVRFLLDHAYGGGSVNQGCVLDAVVGRRAGGLGQ